jgi:DNA end-binding protein Ku
MKALWSGILSFGLVNIPVKLYSASRERSLSFRLLDKRDNCPVSYAKVCRSDNRVISKEDVVKGYEYEEGKYVVLSEEDFKRADARKTGMIEILFFTQDKTIDERYYDKPYYLEPEKKTARAYALLMEAMNESDKIGIARYVLRDREHIGIVKPGPGVLTLIQLRYKDELIDTKEIETPDVGYFKERELDAAVGLVNSMSQPFNPALFRDTYTEELKKIIADKAHGAKPTKKGRLPTPSPSDMNEIIKLLEKSAGEIATK